MTWAAVFLASALVALPATSAARVRRGLVPVGDAVARPVDGDALTVAASLDLLAACLTSGMAVSTAAGAVAASAPPAMAALLSRAADLLALGADPARAWASPDAGERNSAQNPIGGHLESFLRMARRSASSGSALAHGVEELAVQLRADAVDAAGARAERAAVLMAGPLGLCYLPAFLCLGIVPVVAGLAGDVLQSGVL